AVRSGVECFAGDGEQLLAIRNCNAGRPQRRAQIGTPVETAVDLLESIAAVGDFAVGAAPPDADVRRFVDRFARGAETVTHAQLAGHPGHHSGDVAAIR